MKYRIGDVVLVKMVIQNKETFGGYSAILAHASRLEQMDLMSGDIFALVSRKAKKDKGTVYVGGAFTGKLDASEPVKLPGWNYNSLPDNAREVQILWDDGIKCNGTYAAMGWWFYANDPKGEFKAPTNAHIVAWKELDK